MKETFKPVPDKPGITLRGNDRRISATRSAPSLVGPPPPKPVEWTFGYLVPMYLIIVVLALIALPRGFLGLPTAGPATLQGSPALTQERGAEPSIASVAQLAMNGSRERIDGIKDTNDKLLSLIAAMAALLALFGFKGLETFTSFKTRAEETVAKAEQAVKDAKDAHQLATQGVDTFEQFIQNQYARDNGAEIDVYQGLMLLEMADLHEQILRKSRPYDANDRREYCAYLKQCLFFLSKVTDHTEHIDKKTVARALVAQGYAYKRLGDLDTAVRVAKLALDKYDGGNYCAHFNIGCYYCLKAAQAFGNGDHTVAVMLETEALLNLRKAISLNAFARGEALGDADFQHFRDNKNSSFLALIAVLPLSHDDHD